MTIGFLIPIIVGQYISCGSRLLDLLFQVLRTDEVVWDGLVRADTIYNLSSQMHLEFFSDENWLYKCTFFHKNVLKLHSSVIAGSTRSSLSRWWQQVFLISGRKSRDKYVIVAAEYYDEITP